MKRLILAITILILSIATNAQNSELKLFVKDGVAHMRISTSQSKLATDSIMISCGFDETSWSADALNLTSKLKWTISSINDQYIELTKPLLDFSGAIDIETALIFKEMMNNAQFAKSSKNFGFNPKQLFHIRTLNNGLTRFELKGFNSAKEVILSGSFVNWSTLKLPMQRNATGWQIYIDLPDGVYTYKFIVDGNWITDPQNPQIEGDGFGNINSVYAKCNYTFKLNEYLDAKKVILAGSFNNWDEKEIKMVKTFIGWEIQVYLKDGTYPYKFIVDGNWITDPANPDKRKDANGYLNSFLSLGNPAVFKLNNHQDAGKIVLSGSFNDWDETELLMKHRKNYWDIEYVLSPDNYEYKYIIDGHWYLPEDCAITSGEHDEENCVLVLNPNHTFRLEGFDNAGQVRLSGNFNGWKNPGYSMKRVDGGWEIALHLEPGKYSYQFVVDGNWTPDPKNPEFEINEFGGKNSVVWLGL